jgi:hypothetical protein
MAMLVVTMARAGCLLPLLARRLQRGLPYSRQRRPSWPAGAWWWGRAVGARKIPIFVSDAHDLDRRDYRNTYRQCAVL